MCCRRRDISASGSDTVRRGRNTSRRAFDAMCRVRNIRASHLEHERAQGQHLRVTSGNRRARDDTSAATPRRRFDGAPQLDGDLPPSVATSTRRRGFASSSLRFARKVSCHSSRVRDTDAHHRAVAGNVASLVLASPPGRDIRLPWLRVSVTGRAQRAPAQPSDRDPVLLVPPPGHAQYGKPLGRFGRAMRRARRRRAYGAAPAVAAAFCEPPRAGFVAS